VTGGSSEAANRLRQKWSAIAVGTSILAISYWAIVFAFIASEAKDGPSPGPAFAFGLVLVPFVFVALAIISRRPALGAATTVAMLLAVATALLVSALVRDAVTGLVAGFGAAGVVALRRELHQGWKFRALAVIGVVTFVLVILRLIPIIGLIAAPLITLPSIGVADLYVDYRAEQTHGR